MTHHDAANTAAAIGKTETWVKRNAQRLPHHRIGRTYTWSDDDIAAILEAARYRPGPQPDDDSDELRPLSGRRRR